MDAFTTYVLADILGICIGLWLYDWAIDSFMEWLVKRRKNGVLKDQGVS